ncbi:MAG: Lrp/AsnC family transcriptional regulator [Candidatus Hodarchaeota archaeon]
MPSLDRNINVDDKDQKIIRLLQENSRLTNNEISKQTDIPQTTVHNRIKKLKQSGIIDKFTIKLNMNLLGLGLTAFIFCNISYRSNRGEKLSQIEVANEIKTLRGVEDVFIVTGEIDLIVKVVIKDVDELNELIVSKLRNIKGVEKTVTSIVLSEI